MHHFDNSVIHMPIDYIKTSHSAVGAKSITADWTDVGDIFASINTKRDQTAPGEYMYH